MIKQIKNNILVTICAKGNSRGLKGKNIKKFHNKPLIYYAIKKAFDNNFNYICLSTESKKIQKIGVKYKLKSFFLRSKKLSGSNVAKEEVWKDAIIKSENFYKKKFKYILDIEVTNPMLNSRDLSKFISFFFRKKNYLKLNGLFYISPARKNPYFNILKKNKSGYEICIKKKKSKDIFKTEKSKSL